MERIIEQLKEQREKAKETFIKNCLIRRASPPDSPVPDTDSYLDEIYNLNQASVFYKITVLVSLS